MVDKKMEENIAQFCGVTGASVKDAKRFLEKYKRVDVAVDAYYNDPAAIAATANNNAAAHRSGQPSTSKLNALFDKYKDPNEGEIKVDGTIKMCEDLGVNPEDVVLLAVAYELKSPCMGEWTRNGYVEGWKSLDCDNISGMKTALGRLRTRLTSGSDPDYFKKVYIYTFDFAKLEGQRSISIETASAFWELLLPYAVIGGRMDAGGDIVMGGDGDGWTSEYSTWWTEYLADKGGKGVSKDTWTMFLDFIRTIDSRFSNYDLEGSWPSIIDDFVDYAKERLAA